MSSLLPSGCILIGMSCFSFCPLATLRTVSHAQSLTHTHTRAPVGIRRLPFMLLLPSVSVNLILHTFVRTQKMQKKGTERNSFVSGIRFVCRRLPPFSASCCCLLLYPSLLLYSLHLCIFIFVYPVYECVCVCTGLKRLMRFSKEFQ